MLGQSATPQIATNRLILRGWSEDDVEPMTDIYADADVARWLGPIDLSKVRDRMSAWSEHWARRGFGLWAVETKDEGRLIGRVGLMHHDDWTASNHDAEIGWTLSRDAWGRGYATEGARAALEFAEGIGLSRIISITLPHNQRSRRVMERLGLSYQGTAHWHGYDQVWYAMDLATDR